MRSLAWILGLGLAATAPAAPAWLGTNGAAFTANGAAVSVKGEDAASPADAVQKLATARQRGVQLIHLRVDSLPASGTPGVPSEAGWQALDRILAEASRQGVWILPSLASFHNGGGAARLSKRLGGEQESLYLADGRARDWYLYLLQSALQRRNSVSGVAYKDDPALAGWSLAADLGDPEDPAGERAVNWALRGSALIRRGDARHLIGLHYALAAPAALAAVEALNFLVVPDEGAAQAIGQLARPLLLSAPQGWTSAPASSLRLGAVKASLQGPHKAVLSLRSSARCRIQVDLGSGGLLDRRESAGPAQSFTVPLEGLTAGTAYSVRVSALGADGKLALAPPLRLAVPGEAALPAMHLPYSGRIIRAHDGKFWDGNQRFRYLGSNNYYIRYDEDPKVLGEVLDGARAMGMKVLRCQANGERFEPMQAGLYQPMRYLTAGGPTGFQEESFKHYDRLMAEAAKRGIRVIVYITDNWEYFGGMKTWVRWRGMDDKNKFYSDPRVKADFKALILRWANRVNTVNGVPYKDDPALFAWELANEPRDEADTSSKELAGWAQEMASYWKSLDPKHMVSTGLEGSRAKGGTHYSGADFELVQSVPAIDFACFHLYPIKSHLRYSLRAAKRAIKDYVRTAHDVMKKPVVMEEFGIEKKYEGELNRYEWISGMMQTFIDAGGDGINHWMLVHDGYPGGDGFEIAPGDVEYANLFKRLSAKLEGGKP